MKTKVQAAAMEPTFYNVATPKPIVLGLEVAIEGLLAAFKRGGGAHTLVERKALDAAEAALTDLSYHRAGAAGR